MRWLTSKLTASSKPEIGIRPWKRHSDPRCPTCTPVWRLAVPSAKIFQEAINEEWTAILKRELDGGLSIQKVELYPKNPR